MRMLALLLFFLLVLSVQETMTAPATVASTGTSTASLISLNQNVTCAPILTTIRTIMPNGKQALAGSPWQVNLTVGGIPNKRMLSPPCFITNINGTVVSSFVEVDGVYFPNGIIGDYHYETGDCASHFASVNGGLLFPGNQTVCDSTGNIDPVGTANPCNFCGTSLHIEFDRDWMGAGFCGPGRGVCDNNTIAVAALAQTSLNLQGFVYWDPPKTPTDTGHWELHAITAWIDPSLPPPGGSGGGGIGRVILR